MYMSEVARFHFLTSLISFCLPDWTGTTLRAVKIHISRSELANTTTRTDCNE